MRRETLWLLSNSTRRQKQNPWEPWDAIGTPPQAKKPLWETGDKPQASEPASGDNPPSSQQGLRGASTGGILGREPSATWRGLERLPVSLGRLGLQSRDEPGQVSLGVGGGGGSLEPCRGGSGPRAGRHEPEIPAEGCIRTGASSQGSGSASGHRCLRVAGEELWCPDTTAMGIAGMWASTRVGSGLSGTPGGPAIMGIAQ